MTTPELSSLWFVRLPRLVARRSRSLAYLLADGHFLVTHPRLAAVATPVVALLGLLWGASTLGYERVFSESLALIVVACIFGFVSTNLGLGFVAGFALGDFFIGETRWSMALYYSDAFAGDGVLAALVRLRAPMFIGYLLLLALVVYIPRISRLLIADIPQTTRLPKKYAFAVASILNVVVVAVFARFWAEASAVLVGPLFTWQFHPPTVAAISPLQQQTQWIVFAAIAATVLRFGLLWRAYSSETSTRRIVQAEQALAMAIPEKKSATGRIGPVTAAVAAALISTAALSGLFGNWILAAVCFAVFLLLHLVRRGVLPPSLDWWKRIAARVPLLIRLGVGFLILSSLRDLIASENDPDFDRLAVYVIGSVVLLFALLPGPPRPVTNAEEVRT